MPRSFTLAFLALAVAGPAFAADSPDAPEKLLPPTTQFFVRWDGIAARKEAYKKSIWGGVMAGPTGESIRTLLAAGPKLLGSVVLADPLLQGKSPKELKAHLVDLKATEKLVDLIADRGVLIAAQVRAPSPTLRDVGQALGGLIKGEEPGADVLMPDVELILIVPDVGEKAEVLFGAFRTIVRVTDGEVQPFQSGGRKGFRLVSRKKDEEPGKEDKEPTLPLPLGDKLRKPIPLSDKESTQAAWWVEGKHFVYYAGPRKLETVIAEMQTNAKKGGLTAHPLFQRCSKPGKFDAVTRGFVDTGRVMTLAKGLASLFMPGLKERLDSNGISNLKAIVFTSGFDGKESRALWEFDIPGERKGLAKAIVNKPLGLNDLPPMPPDVTRFSALRLDPTATYDALVGIVEFVSMNSEFGVEKDASKNTPAAIQARKEYLMREADKLLGITLKDDLLQHLGDKVVTYQSPAEGFQILGTVVCISVKDATKVKTATARLQGAVESFTGPVRLRKKMLKGVEIRELHSKGFGFVTPTYAVVDDWLVIAAYPQLVQGFVLRAKDGLARWKPDAATAKRLAKLPADGFGLQYCSPKSTVETLCTLGPIFFSVLGALDSGSDEADSSTNPLDVSLVPNAHELNRHLFPNLTVTRDDGKTISVEVSESFSLPLEFIGVEALGVAIVLGLGI